MFEACTVCSRSGNVAIKNKVALNLYALN
jgi:hypothetical protein